MFVDLPELFVQTVANAMSAGEQGPARRHTGRRTDIEICAANALASEPVDSRRLDNLVAVAAEIAVADIVDKHQYDVGLTGRCFG